MKSSQPIPDHLKDLHERLSATGFQHDNRWYHGTTADLVPSILEHGLKRSGDLQRRQADKQTMATIGNSMTEQIEPVFITPSKELAWYWAQESCIRRKRINKAETQAVIIEISLPESLQTQVQPDVGAASMLMIGISQYPSYIISVYEQFALPTPPLDPKQLARMDYLNCLGMAYINRDLAPEYLRVLPSSY